MFTRDISSRQALPRARVIFEAARTHGAYAPASHLEF